MEDHHGKLSGAPFQKQARFAKNFCTVDVLKAVRKIAIVQKLQSLAQPCASVENRVEQSDTLYCTLGTVLYCAVVNIGYTYLWVKIKLF